MVTAAAYWPHGSLAQGRRRGAARLLDPWPLPRPPGWATLVDRPETPQELAALRVSAQRGIPYGDAEWQAAMADRFGLCSPGRPPRREREEGESAS